MPLVVLHKKHRITKITPRKRGYVWCELLRAHPGLFVSFNVFVLLNTQRPVRIS